MVVRALIARLRKEQFETHVEAHPVGTFSCLPYNVAVIEDLISDAIHRSRMFVSTGSSSGRRCGFGEQLTGLKARAEVGDSEFEAFLQRHRRVPTQFGLRERDVRLALTCNTREGAGHGQWRVRQTDAKQCAVGEGTHRGRRTARV